MTEPVLLSREGEIAIVPLNEPERVGVFQLAPYLQAVGLFLVHNAVLAGAIIYCLTVLTRNTVYAFIAALVLMVGFLLAGLLTPQLETPASVLLLDPFGLRTLHALTKYWTVAEKNTQVLAFAGPLLTNRLVWLGIAGALMGLTHGLFSFTTATGTAKKRRLADAPAPTRTPTPAPQAPRVPPRHDRGAALVQLTQQVQMDVQGIFKSVPFWILLGVGVLNLLSIAVTASERDGGHFFPVTYTMLDLFNGTYGLFVVAVLVYYGGVLVWKEQDARLDGILDASPRPSWVPYAATMLTLVAVAALLTGVGVLVCVAAQALQGYTHFEWSLYGKAAFGIEFTRYVMVAVGTVFLHVLLRNKFLAYGLTVAIILFQSISGEALDWNNNLLRFADTPAFTYSDMNGLGLLRRASCGSSSIGRPSLCCWWPSRPGCGCGAGPWAGPSARPSCASRLPRCCGQSRPRACSPGWASVPGFTTTSRCATSTLPRTTTWPCRPTTKSSTSATSKPPSPA